MYNLAQRWAVKQTALSDERRAPALHLSLKRGYAGYCQGGICTQGAQANYGTLTSETNYLYLRVSQQESFDIVYFTPALTWIYNLNDRSFSITPELLYEPITNLELRLRAGFLVAGQKNSEFGEKQNDYKVELRVRYYF